MIIQGTDILREHKNKTLTFTPELKQINFLDKRCYKRDENRYYPSVTTILQYFPKNKFFEQWLKEVGQNADIIAAKAAKEGTQVHEAAEKLVLGEEVHWIDEYGNAKYSQLVWEMIMKFHDFWTSSKPTLLHSELFTYSDEHEYAGTADLVVELDGKVWLLDLKTANTLYKAYDLQLAAYAKALEETRGIKVDKAGVLWLKSMKRGESKKEGTYQGKGWEVKETENLQTDFELFLSIYKIFKLENPKTEPVYLTYPTTLKL